MTDFRRMRFGLGVTLMTDGYFANDLGGGFYGAPTRYTEYTHNLGQAVADSVRVFPRAYVCSLALSFHTIFFRAFLLAQL
jgi:hypothetical protein